MILLRDRLRLNWWRVAIAWALLWLIDSVLYSYIAGVYWSSPGVIGFMQDLPAQIALVLWTGSIVMAYYVWSGNAFTSLIWRLQHSGCLQPVSHCDPHSQQTHDYLRAAERLHRLWNHPSWGIGSLLITVIWVPFVFLPMVSQWSGLWWSIHPAYYVYFLVKSSLETYVVIRIVVMEILSIYSLCRFVEWRVLSFRPFHPDRAGGLLAIGQYRLKFIYGLAGASVFLLFISLKGSLLSFALPGTVVGFLNIGDVAIYLIAIIMVPVSFFVPIWKVHDFMKLEKQTKIAAVSEVLDVKLRALSQSGQLNYEVETKELGDLLSVMKSLESVPEWPYDTSTVRRFIGSWVSIAASPFVGVVVDLLLRSLP